MAPLSKIKNAALPVFKKFRVVRAGIFGSNAVGTPKNSSDVDILVELDDSANLFEFVELKQQLEKSLHKKVDLVEYSSIKPVLRKNILGSEVRIYEKAG